MNSTDGNALIDISQGLSESTVVWPGDTPFTREWVMRIAEGASCNVSTLRMSVHCGTHSDAPYHFDEKGDPTEAFDLDAFIGPCRVVEVRSEDGVHASDLEGIDLARDRRLLFKTRRPCTATTWRDDFSFVGVDAARLLAESKILLFGLDTPSIDPMESKTLEAHHILANAGIRWIENLELSHVTPGHYELIALPLKIAGGDAAPVRAVLRTNP